MQLANPAALWLLVLVPVLLFVRQRTARRSMPVAAMYLWSSAPPRDVTLRPHQVRWDRQLALQLAILLSIIVALARPTVASNDRPVALVIDVSASMGAADGGGTRLDTATARAAAAVANLPPATRVGVFAVSSEVEARGTFDASDPALLAALRSLEPTGAAGDLAAAVLAVQAQGIERIHVFSDATAGAADGVEWSRVGTPADNVAVSGIHVGPASADGPQLEVLAAVTNYGDAAVGTDLVLLNGTREVTRQSLNLAPHTTVTVSHPLAGVGGIVTARVLHRDALTTDNERSVIASAPSPMRVRLTGRANRFVTRAIQAMQDAGIVIVVGPGSAAPDLTICVACADAGGAGSTLLVAPPSTPGPPSAPLALTGIDHAVLDSVLADGILVVPTPGLPVLRSGTVLARAGASPVLIVEDSGARRAVELRADLDRSALAMDAAFPLLVANVVTWLGAAEHVPAAVTIGEPVRVVLPAQTSPRGTIVTGPRGQQIDFTVVGRTLTVNHATTPGVYRVAYDGGEVSLAVNPAVDGESDLRSAPAPVDVAVGAAGTADRRRELTALLLMAAAALLLAEWRLRHPTSAHVAGS